MYKALRVTPINGTDYLGCPPSQVRLGYLALWRRFDDVPEVSTVGILHDKVQGGVGLKGTEQMGSPEGLGGEGPEEYITFGLRRALLVAGVENGEGRQGVVRRTPRAL